MNSISLIFLLISCRQGGEDLSGPQSGIPANQSYFIKIDLPESHDIDINKDTLTYLALGDSYTIGSGVKPEESLPWQLTDSIAVRGYTLQAPQIIAAGGWTTTDLINQTQNSNTASKYDLVSLLIGVNNQYLRYDFGKFKSEFMNLLGYCVSKGKSRSSIFVLSIPDYGYTPFGQNQKEEISHEIEVYNDFIRDVCGKNRIKFYDITAISRLGEGNPDLLAADGLHPSALMYALWVEEIMQSPPAIIKK